MIALAPPESAASSHLAFALRILPTARGRDAMVFFRFCRAVDDLADEPGGSMEERRADLIEWRDAVERGPMPAELADVVTRHGIDPHLLAEIVRGCEMDLDVVRFETFAELERYCWRVACAVGLVAIRIFGCREPGSAQYAEHLGHALQLTNILRDVGEDAGRGRVYLPEEDLRRFGVEREAILRGEPGAGFQELMRFEAGRARGRFHAAVPLPGDEEALLAPQIMKALYLKILGRLEMERFPVFSKRVRLNRAEKLLTALGPWLSVKFPLTRRASQR